VRSRIRRRSIVAERRLERFQGIHPLLSLSTVIAVYLSRFAALIGQAAGEQLLGGPGAELDAELNGELRIGNVTWIRAGG
jgi:hypothetical protein